jgi:hypothetical protein
MWRVINHDDNVLVEINPETGVKHFLSPTIYLQRWSRSGNNQGYAQTCWQLEQLLRTKNCADRYYAELGADQPAGAVGMPENIAKEDKRRRDDADKHAAREFDHREKLRREWEEAQQKDRIDASKHEAWRVREVDKTATKIDTSKNVHQNQLDQTTQMSAKQLEALAAKNLVTEQALRQQQALKLGHQQQTNVTLRQQQDLKLDHQLQTGRQKFMQQARQEMLNRESAQAKLEAEKKLMNVNAAASKLKLQNKKAMDEQKAREQKNDLVHKRKMLQAKK